MKRIASALTAPACVLRVRCADGPPARLELLKGITGYAVPGTLTALMVRAVLRRARCRRQALGPSSSSLVHSPVRPL